MPERRASARFDADRVVRRTSAARSAAVRRWAPPLALAATLHLLCVTPARAQPVPRAPPPAASGATPGAASGAGSGGEQAADATAAATVDCSACGSGAGPGGGGEGNAEEPGKLGLHYELETIRIRGNRRTLDRVILRYVPFRPGDTLDIEDPELELVRFRLLGTGYFSDVQLSLSKGPKRGVVILNIDVVERNTLVVNDLWLGVSADATPDGKTRPLTAFGGVDVAETNFYGTGVSIGGAVAVADRQSAYRLRFADPSFLRSKWIVSVTLLYNDARDFFGTKDVLYDRPPGVTEQTDYAVATYKRRGGEFGLGYDTSTSTRLRASYHLEWIDASIPRAASSRRGDDIAPIDFHLIDGRSLLSYLALQIDDDTRDDPVLATRGHWVQLGADLGLPTLGSDYSFLRFQGRASQWWTLPWGALGGHVFRVDAFGGAVFGSAPLFMRYYVGDLTDFLPDRVLDLNFDRRPPPNFLHTSVVEMRYEELAFRISGEYRIPLYQGHRSIYGVDLFGSAGFYAITSRRDIADPIRGYHGFSRLPVDFTFNVGLRISTSAGGFMLALSNAIGFFPIRSGP